jgi:hypothetical protein
MLCVRCPTEEIFLATAAAVGCIQEVKSSQDALRVYSY